ncbi:site-specific DNA-methyltransferase [Brevibacillus sp. VP]|nr:site-specific DNA-methyltransferase [Brevibacillus sp. VP]
MDESIEQVDKILQGNSLEVLKMLPDQSINCCVTSPPYWGLRDYGVDGQLGLEPTPEEFVANMVRVFREVRRVLKDDGTLWLNLGDSYWANRSQNGLPWKDSDKHKNHMIRAGGKSHEYLKPKDLVGIPWRVALALQADGWYLRSDIIWSKPNPMPESVGDRPTKAHEYIFLLSKSERYFYDAEIIKEKMAQSSLERLSQNIENQEGSYRANAGGKTNGNMKAVGGSKGAFGPLQSRKRNGNKERKHGGDRGRPESNPGSSIPREGSTRNKRSVWTVATAKTTGAHFAVFPPKLIEPCILAGCPQGGIVLDPFTGSGTTPVVARNLGRKYLGIELNPDYIKIAEDRIKRETAQMNIFEFGT